MNAVGVNLGDLGVLLLVAVLVPNGDVQHERQFKTSEGERSKCFDSR
jgi:hypothetical protein